MKLVIYRIIGFFSQHIFPSISHCYRCGRTWNICKEHCTRFIGNEHEEGQGCFPLCEYCWSSLTIEKRLPYYAYLVLDWMKINDHEESYQKKWPLIKKAVLEGK